MKALTPADFGATPKEWRTFGWQVKHRVRTREALERLLRLTSAERAGVDAAEKQGGFEWGITPYYLSLVDRDDPRDPIRLQCVPRIEEEKTEVHDLVDPLGEDPKMPVEGIVHRYADRVLLLLTDRCSVYCRFCTRRRLVGTEERQMTEDEVERAARYVESDARIREVIVSGGDPLVAGDRYLDRVLARFRAIPHVELLRVHTRMPVVCPQRVTDPLAKILRAHAPVWVVTHFNHPYELTAEARDACERLADRGVPVANQSVLLAGVNTDPVILEALSRELLKARVRPYYLHQGDLANGTGHFRTPLSAGVEIAGALRGRISGLGIPALIVDLPGGKGKVQLAPDPVVERHGREVTFRAPLGGTARYVEPAMTDLTCSTRAAVARRWNISAENAAGAPLVKIGRKS